MFRILKIMYTSPAGKLLWFKWWTALYFFYQLPRFSVDLDFDIINPVPQDFKETLFTVLEKELKSLGATIKYDWTLQNSFRFIVQYGWDKKLKIECTTHEYPNHYTMNPLLWLTVQTMDIRRMFAHKLCAFFSRQQHRWYIANRDLYDIHFLFMQNIIPHEAIIRIRTEKLFGKTLWNKEFYAYRHEYLSKNQKILQNSILDWLGELLEPKQKQRVKDHLLQELSEQFQLRLL